MVSALQFHVRQVAKAFHCSPSTVHYWKKKRQQQEREEQEHTAITVTTQEEDYEESNHSNPLNSFHHCGRGGLRKFKYSTEQVIQAVRVMIQMSKAKPHATLAEYVNELKKNGFEYSRTWVSRVQKHLQQVHCSILETNDENDDYQHENEETEMNEPASTRNGRKKSTR